MKCVCKKDVPFYNFGPSGNVLMISHLSPTSQRVLFSLLA